MSLKDLFDLIAGRFRSKFATPFGWLAAFLVGTLSALSFSKAQFELQLAVHIAISITTGIACAVIAHHISRPPKFTNGTVGILIATTTETLDEENRIKNDLVPAFRRIFAEQSLLKFDVKVLPKEYTTEIETNQDALKFINRCNAVLMIQGAFKTRRKKGELHYLLTVKGLVKHKQTHQENKKLLQAEMTEIIPSKTTIDCQNDLSGMELAAEQYAYGALYTIAIAALISGHWEVAKGLLSDLRAILTNSATRTPRLAQMVDKRILNCTIIQIDDLIFRWRGTHDTDLIKRVNTLIDHSEVAWNGSYEILNARAICHFVLNRNIGAAKALLEKSRSLPNAQHDSALLYSLAFLAAYAENFSEATSLYYKAFKTTTENQRKVPIEVEEFIAWLLEVEPHKIQFYYYLALINYHVKQDMDAAMNDLNDFRRLGGHNVFPALQQSSINLATLMEKGSKTGTIFHDKTVKTAHEGKMQ